MCNRLSTSAGVVAASHSGSTGAVYCYSGYTRIRTSLSCTGRPSVWSTGIDAACKRSLSVNPRTKSRPALCHFAACNQFSARYGDLRQSYHSAAASSPVCDSGAIANTATTAYNCTSSGTWSPTPNFETLCLKSHHSPVTHHDSRWDEAVFESLSPVQRPLRHPWTGRRRSELEA